MKFIKHKTKDEGIILCFNEDDKKSLETFYRAGIIFGLWKIWFKHEDKRGENLPTIQALLKAYPDAIAVGWVNEVKGFVSAGETKEIGNNPTLKLL